MDLRKKNFSWVTYDNVVDELNVKGTVKSFNSIYSKNKKLSSDLIFLMNIYPPIDYDSSLNDEYALKMMLSWIYNNANIENGFSIFIASSRMKKLLEKFISTYN